MLAITRLRLSAVLGSFGAALLVAACATSSSAPTPWEATGRAQSPVTAAPANPAIMPMLPPPRGARRGAPAAGVFASYQPTGGCGSPLQYFGGPIIADPTVVQVSWNDSGTNGAVPSTVESYLEAWYPAILSPQANYLALLTQYGTAGLNGQDGMPGSNQTFSGQGTYGGLFKITPSVANQGATIDDTQIAAELVAQIGAGTLPAPTFDGNGHCDTLYMIDFPPTVTSITFTFAGQQAASCKDFCGYHMGTTYQGKPIFYGVHPDFTQACPSCAPDGLQQDLGLIHSHELAEAMTDPEAFLENLTASSTNFSRPGGWDQIAQGCSEIGDSCAWPSQAGAAIPTVSYGGSQYYVQGLFDNQHTDCEWQGTTPQCTSNAQCSGTTPLCDATSHQCRACTATDCSSPTPACVTAGPNAGHCAQCAASTDCGGATPVCDASTNTCRACTAGDCAVPTPVCATSGANAGRCVACASNADCSGTNHACDATSGTCVGCVSNGDCTNGVCDTTAHVCVQCQDDGECMNPTPVCQQATHTCGPCTASGDCAGNSNGHVCYGGSCVGCASSGDCPSGQACDPSSHTCTGSGSSSGSGSGSGSGSSSGSGSGAGSSSGASGSGGNCDGIIACGDGGSGNGDQGSTGSTGGCAVSGAGTDGGGCGVAAAGLLLGLALARRRRVAR